MQYDTVYCTVQYGIVATFRSQLLCMWAEIATGPDRPTDPSAGLPLYAKPHFKRTPPVRARGGQGGVENYEDQGERLHCGISDFTRKVPPAQRTITVPDPVQGETGFPGRFSFTLSSERASGTIFHHETFRVPDFCRYFSYWCSRRFGHCGKEEGGVPG